MPEGTEDTFAASVVSAALSAEETDDAPEETEPDPEPADGEEEEEESEGGSETQDPDEDEPAPDSYEKVEDPKKLRELLRSKDKGYEKQKPFIETGKLIAGILDPSNPEREKGIEALMAQIAEATGKPAKAETPTWEPPKPPDDADEETLAYWEEAKEHFRTFVEPYVAHRVTEAVSGLKAEIDRLKAEVSEPLEAYKGSREEAAFKARVEQAAPEALRLFKLRTGQEGDTARLAEAMKRFPQEKPVNALQAYMALQAQRPAKTDAKRPGPTVPKSSERKERRHVDANQDLNAALTNAVEMALAPHFGG